MVLLDPSFHTLTRALLIDALNSGTGTFSVLPCRYSDFHGLHQELKSTFSSAKFPPLPKKIFFGRSQTKAVAQQRMKDLQLYLQVVKM